MSLLAMNFESELLTFGDPNLERNGSAFGNGDSPFNQGLMRPAVQPEELLFDLFGNSTYSENTIPETKLFADAMPMSSGLLPSPEWDDSLSFALPSPAQQQQQHLSFNFISALPNANLFAADGNSHHLTCTPVMSPGPYSPSVPSPSPSCGKAEQSISDDDLQNLPVRDLNRLVKTLSLDCPAVAALKSRRRTLKNRTYAHACRQRRHAMRSTLHVQHVSLEKQLTQLVDELNKVREERDTLRTDVEQLKRRLTKTAVAK